MRPAMEFIKRQFCQLSDFSIGNGYFMNDFIMAMEVNNG